MESEEVERSESKRVWEGYMFKTRKPWPCLSTYEKDHTEWGGVKSTENKKISYSIE